MEAKYCLQCGSPLSVCQVDGAQRLACTSCSYVHWGNYSVGVGALILRDDKVLLVRRAQDPGKGYWTNPGGYIEQHEPIEETVVREVLEETGVRAKVKGIVAFRDQPRAIHNVYIAFAMEYIDGEPKADMFEVDDAGFFTYEELQTMNVAGFTKWLLDIAFQSGSKGLVKDNTELGAGNANGFFRVF
jgi:ADP-ribose pyrophosphatase YjhB (NUDIX family)